MIHFKIAQLNQEQLQQLHDLEDKLNVTLVAYDPSAMKREAEEFSNESHIDSSYY